MRAAVVVCSLAVHAPDGTVAGRLSFMQMPRKRLPAYPATPFLYGFDDFDDVSTSVLHGFYWLKV
jgi:hypothetical protein